MLKLDEISSVVLYMTSTGWKFPPVDVASKSLISWPLGLFPSHL